jgi:hypothetical protein
MKALWSKVQIITMVENIDSTLDKNDEEFFVVRM